MRFDERHSLLLGALLVAGTLVYGVLIVTSGPQPVAGEGRRLFVDLKSTGNLELGAPVRRSGIELGRVVALRKRPTPGEPQRLAPLRLVLWVEQAKVHLVPRTAQLYIASPSPLGKRHVEVGLPPRPSDLAARQAAFTAAPADHVFRGIDPPLLDRLVNVGWRSFGEIWAFVREQAPAVSKLSAGLDRLQKRLERLSLERRLPPLARKLEALVAEGRALVAVVRPRLARGKRSAAQLTTTVKQRRARLRELVSRGEQLAKRLRTLSQLVGPAQRQRLARIATRLRQTTALVKGGATKLRALLAGLKRGRGTLGRLLNDRELNSDLKASHKALKSAPWRVLRLPPQRKAPRRKAPRRSGSGSKDGTSYEVD
jgi:ABC-type transporter Mla subunit MlaD